MAITASAISALVARFGNKIVEEQVNQNAPVTSMIDKLNQSGRVGVVNVKAGGLDSTAWIDDGDTLPTSAARDLVQVTYLPKIIFSHGAIPRLAATLASGEGEGINLVLEEIESMGAQLGRRLADGIINGVQKLVQLTTAQATELGAAGTTLTVSDHSRFRTGDVIERYDDDGGTGASTNDLMEYLRVVAVDVDEDGSTHTITFARDITGLSGTAPAQYDQLFVRGAKFDGMASLKDISAAASLYGKAETADEWSGNLKSLSSTALDVQIMRDLFTKICQRRGQSPDFALCNSRVRQKYSDLLLNQRRYISGKMDATGGMDIEFEGRPVKVDDNCGSTDLYFVTKKDVKLHVFRDFGDEADGGKGKGASTSGHALVSDDTFVYKFQRWGAFNLRVTRRNGCGNLSNIA